MTLKLSEKQKKSGWQMIKFGEIARDVKSTTKTPLEDGLKYYVGLEHLDPQSLRLQRKGLIAEDNPSFTRLFKPGHILFGKRRCYQKKAAVANFEGICSGDIIVMEAVPGKIIPELLPFIVQSDMFFAWAEKTSSGSLSPRTKWKALAEFDFPLPPLERQKAILEVLEKVENAYLKSIQISNSNRQLLSSLLHETCGWLAKLKSTDDLEERLPKGYKLFRIDDLLVEHKRPVKMKDKMKYKTVTAKRAHGGIELREIQVGKKILVKSQFEIRKGDFLISKRQIVHGGCGIVPKDLDTSIVSNEYNVFRTNDKLDLNFFKWLVQTPRMMNYFFINSVGVHIEKMLFKTDQWVKMKLILPAIEQQKLIGELLESLSMQNKSISQKKAYLIRTRNMLLLNEFRVTK